MKEITETITTKVFFFDELSEAAKKDAIRNYREEHKDVLLEDETDFLKDDFRDYGLRVDWSEEPIKIFEDAAWSCAYMQGDYFSFYSSDILCDKSIRAHLIDLNSGNADKVKAIKALFAANDDYGKATCKVSMKIGCFSEADLTLRNGIEITADDLDCLMLYLEDIEEDLQDIVDNICQTALEHCYSSYEEAISDGNVEDMIRFNEDKEMFLEDGTLR